MTAAVTREPLTFASRPTREVALRHARWLGCTVEPVKRTGEFVVIASCGCRTRINNRRHEATTNLLALILHVQGMKERPVQHLRDQSKDADRALSQPTPASKRVRRSQ